MKLGSAVELAQVVERELIDLARVELSKAVTDPLEQRPELLLVIRSNHLARGPTLGLVATLRTIRLGDAQKLQPGSHGLEGGLETTQGPAIPPPRPNGSCDQQRCSFVATQARPLPSIWSRPTVRRERPPSPPN